MHDATNNAASIEVQMAFAKASDVQADTERLGMLRAATHSIDAHPRAVSELRGCRLRDWTDPAAPRLDLEEMGFDSVDLSGCERLQSTLESVRQAGLVTRADASAIRAELRGRSFTLSNGKHLRLVVIAPEGFIMRKAGPNGLRPDPEIEMSEMNGITTELDTGQKQDRLLNIRREQQQVHNLGAVEL
jgi:hypothetical protein